MPPLPPNVTKAGLVRSHGGWNNSSLSRRSTTTRGLLSTRVPQSLGTTGGGVPNPVPGIGTIKEAMPRHAAGSWKPVSLQGPYKWPYKWMVPVIGRGIYGARSPSGPWTLLYPTTEYIYSVRYGGGHWVAVGLSLGHVSNSAGTEWESVSMGDGGYHSAFDGNNWLVGLNSDISVATDPLGTWTQSAMSGINIRGIAEGGGNWVVGGALSPISNQPVIQVTTSLTSPISWSTATLPMGDYGNINGLHYNGVHWVGVSGKGYIFVADDGAAPEGAWSLSPTQASSGLVDVHYAAGNWVAVGNNRVLYVADDPSNPAGTWTRYSSTTLTSNVYEVTYGDGRWVLCTVGGTVYTATNPRADWEPVHTFPSFGVYGIGFRGVTG